MYVVGFESRSGRGVQHYVIRFVSDLRWFSLSTPVSSTNKTDHLDRFEIFLKVASNTITQTNKRTNKQMSKHVVTLGLFLYYGPAYCNSCGRCGCDRMVVDLQLHVLPQSVPITTKGVSSNPGHGDVYMIDTTLYDKVCQ